MKVAFYKAAEGTPLDKIIDGATGLYGYSHCEFVFDQMEDGVRDGKYLCFSSSPREGYVRFKHIDINSGRWHVVDLPGVDVKAEREVYESAHLLLGSKYDYYGIIFWYVFFWVKKQRDDQWWCSEVLAYLMGWPHFRVTPNRLAKSLGAPKIPFSAKFVWRKSY